MKELENKTYIEENAVEKGGMLFMIIFFLPQAFEYFCELVGGLGHVIGGGIWDRDGGRQL